MRRIVCCLLITVSLVTTSFAQNVGIGTNEPANKMHIVGNIVVHAPTTSTNTGPTAPQTKTLVNASTIAFLNTDSTGRLYDPGGPAGNYIANLVANANIPASGNIGIEITVESMGLGTGDSLIIKENSFSTSYLLAVGNGYATTGKWMFNSSTLYIIFKSNADANTGIGFSLLYKRLYTNTTSLPDLSGAIGNALFFDTKNGSFRSGYMTNAARGSYSTAMGSAMEATGLYSTALGFFTNASGEASTAMGNGTNAVGTYAVAMGVGSSANGIFSTAMGDYTTAGGVASTSMGSSTHATGNYSTSMGLMTTASGDRSTAMGSTSVASGDFSTAIGNDVIASGQYSFAIGSYVNTNNHNGAFLIGDNSTTTVMNGTTPNNFRARFDGGYRFYTSSDYSTSCALSPGANAWSTSSDVRLKENFELIDGEDFLKKIAMMRLVSWNYKKQDPSKFRHYGPMAQEFYAAFGKDKYGNIGNDTTINQADFDGVNLIAIQALEKRTAEQKKEIDELKAIILQLQNQVKAMEGKQEKKLFATFK